MSKFLSGQDASILALLAQAPTMSKHMREKLIGSLGRKAQPIGWALIGEPTSKRASKAANVFREWAKNL
jgi:hypothetical protein